MRPVAQYRALHDIPIPGSDYAFAARTGDDINEIQRVNGRLIVGDDPATADIEPLTADAMDRPDDDADRLEWQNYAVIAGVPFNEAVALDRDDLIKKVGPDPGLPEGVTAVRPLESDRKALWASYAAEQLTRSYGFGLTEARDRADGATKAELVAAFGDPADEKLLGELTARNEPDAGEVTDDDTAPA